jgi:hypothetical protein
MSHPTTPRTWYKTPLRVIYGDPMGYWRNVATSRAPRPALAVWMRVWTISRSLLLVRVPRPRDATRVHAPGDRPDWVLIVGNGAARGWGVRSHKDALPGHLAHALSARTGRGTDVVVVEADTLSAIRSAILVRVDARYDAIVVVTGVDDALALRDPQLWRENVRAFLTHLSGPTGVDSPIVLVGIPPIRSISVFDTTAGDLAAAHAIALNEITRAACAEFPRASFAHLPDPGPRAVNTHRDSATYCTWATSVADTVLPLVDPQGPHLAAKTS